MMFIILSQGKSNQFNFIRDGGKSCASRFVTAFNKHGAKEKLTLFSGDLFAPSICIFIN